MRERVNRMPYAVAGGRFGPALVAGCWLLAVSALTGCGFEPVHGRAARAARVHRVESVRVVTDNTRLGQLLKAEIEDQTNPAGLRAEKPFTLTITTAETEISLFINLDGTSSRGDMQYVSSYVLTRTADGQKMDSGSITRISSYNISENADYASYVSREDARKRGIIELARDYNLRLSNLVPRLNGEVQPEPVSEPQPAPAPLMPVQDNHEARTPGY